MIDIASTIIFLSLSERGQTKVTMLWKKYHKKMKYIVFRLVKDESVSDEIVGDAFVRFMTHYDAYENYHEQRMKAILIKTARRLAYNKVESAMRRKTDPLTMYTDEGDEYDRVLMSDNNVEELIINRENIDRIKEALVGMQRDYSDVIRLRTYSELDYREISSIMGITEAAARKRFERGVKIIKKKLNER